MKAPRFATSRRPTPEMPLAPSLVVPRACSCAAQSGPVCSGEASASRDREIQADGVTGLQGLAAHMEPSAIERTLRSPGQMIDPNVRTYMERRFQFDLSRVRVHTDAPAADSARDLAARAYTVGHHIAFAAGRFAPDTLAGQHLLAHELAHVVQQGGRTASRPASRLEVGDDGSELEAEAEGAADAVMTGRSPLIARRCGPETVRRHKDDIVAYTGGQSGHVIVIKAGVVSSVAPGVSGHPGHREDEKSVGPVPAGRYTIHPGIQRPTVTTLQSGTCGADPIESGYQEITSTDPSPCTGRHYCNVSCPTPAEPTRMCFTPQDCWGPKRIKIEGSASVATADGGKVRRDGFYLHGGNPADAVSSGCVKSLDNDVFGKVRELTGVGGKVPFCIGTGCPPAVQSAVEKEQQKAIRGLRDFLGKFFD